MPTEVPPRFPGFLNGDALLQAAMCGPSECIPVYAQLHELSMAEQRIPARLFHTNPELLASAKLATADKYGFDLGYVDYGVHNIEAEALGQALVFFDDHFPDVDRAAPLIRTVDDLKRIKTPDFDRAGRFPMSMELLALNQKYAGLTPPLQFCASFSLAANRRGIEAPIFDLIDNSAFAQRLFDTLVENVIIPLIENQIAHSPQAASVGGSDATSSLPLVIFSIYRQWVLPSIQRLQADYSRPVFVPNWGGERYLKRPEEMLELKLLAAPGFLEGQDPDVKAPDPEIYKRLAEARDVPLVLGVGTAFLEQAASQKVSGRVQHYVEIGSSNGRFALYLCILGGSTPSANIWATIETAHAWDPT